MSTDSYTLTYFNGRGTVEPSRVMLAIANQPFEDIRVPSGEYPQRKGSGEFYLNMDRLPILTINGTFSIGQSKAINRFIAKKFGFLGSNDLESAQVDMISEHVRDIAQKYFELRAGKSGDELEVAKTNFLKKDLISWMEKLEKCLGSDGYAVGSKLSLADIYIQQLAQDFFDDKDSAAAAIANCPKIQASCAAVREAAKEWLESRPVTPF